jgi:hypothetical protein
MSKIGEDGKLQLDHQDEVVFRLGLIISAAMNRLSIEQRRPGSGADESDDLVQDLTKRVADLRRIRTEFEEVQSGVVVGGPPAPVKLSAEVTPDQERVLRAAAQWWQHHHLETLILDCDQELRAAVSQLVRRGKATPGLEKVDDATERSRWERVVRVVRAAQAVRNHIRHSGLDRLLDGAAPQELCAAVEVLQPGDVTE